MFNWKDLPIPIIGLTPMDGVTDFPMREIQSQIAKPSVMFTEFISVEGFSRVPDNFEKKLSYSDNQKPIIVQIFGHTPEDSAKSCKLLVKKGFGGIDINMGCPAKTVLQHGSGGALIGNYELADKIIKACLKVTKDNNIPLSVKTRIGKKEAITEEWIKFLSSFPIDCITVHGRLLKDVHSGENNWDEVAKGAKIAHSKGITYLGNGGIKSIEDAQKVSEEYDLDGVLIGQAAYGNPWIFSDKEPTVEEKLYTLIEHAKLAEEFYGEKGFVSVRKHLAWYCKGVKKSKKLRSELVMTSNHDEVKVLVEKFRDEI